MSERVSGLLRSRRAWPVAAIGFLAVLTVVLAQNPAGAAFTASTGDTGNSVTSAASFCTTPGTTTLIASGDSYTDESAPTNNYNSDSLLRVRSITSRNDRTWIRFTLPSKPAGCSLTAATLRVYNRQPVANRVVDVYRGDPTAPLWNEATITWANQPTAIGFPIGGSLLSSAGWQVWGVLDHVNAQYTDVGNGLVNNGFELKDRNEDSSTQYEQDYDARQNTATAAQLVLTWG